MAKLQPAIFLDRDGTLIREVGYLCRPDQIELLDGVPAAIRALRDGGFKTVVVTNQSAVARGWLSEAGLKQIHRLLLDGWRSRERCWTRSIIARIIRARASTAIGWPAIAVNRIQG